MIKAGQLGTFLLCIETFWALKATKSFLDARSVSENIIFKRMDILNVLVGITGIFWVVTGIRTHSDWIQSIFLNERKKIRQQKNIISEFGYSSLNTRNKLEAKKGLVFACWDKPVRDQKIEGPNEKIESPIIFQLVSLNLITSTSILFLIALSRGLFSILGLI